MKFHMFRTIPLSIIRSLFTVNSTMAYVIQVCRQLASRTRMELQFHPGLQISDRTFGHRFSCCILVFKQMLRWAPSFNLLMQPSRRDLPIYIHQNRPYFFQDQLCIFELYLHKPHTFNVTEKKVIHHTVQELKTALWSGDYTDQHLSRIHIQREKAGI